MSSATQAPSRGCRSASGSGGPHAVWDLLDQHAGVAGQGPADRVLDPLAGEPVEELVAVPGTIGPDQHPFPGPRGGPARQLLERLPQDGDVVGGGVGAGVPGPQQEGEGLPGPITAVIDEHAQGVEPVALLERRLGVLLVRVRRHQRGVHVHDQRVLHAHAGVGGVLTGQQPRAGPGSGADGVDRLQHPWSIGDEQANQPRDGRVGSHHPVDGRLGPEQRSIGEAVPTQRQGDRQVGQDLARVVGRERFPPPRQRRRQLAGEAGHHRCLREQHAAGVAHDPGGSGVVAGLGIRGGTLHVESASFAWGEWDFAITFSQAGSTFAVQTTESDPTLMKARG